MDTKSSIFLVFLATLLLLDSIYSVPIVKERVNHRLKRQSGNTDSEDDSENDSSKDELGDRISSITDTSSKLIQDLLSTLESSAKIIRDILEAKRKIAEPLLEGTARALETLSESKAIERTLETVQTVAKAGLEASNGISTAITAGSRALGSSSATPALVQGITSVSEIGSRVVRLAICTLICPLQDGDERNTCRKDNCGKIDRSDGLDYYDGDYEEENTTDDV